jgi:hypothetical protein
MNEPMHLVPRSDVLLIMQLLQDSGATVDAVEYMELYHRLNGIIEKKPDNLKEKI